MKPNPYESSNLFRQITDELSFQTAISRQVAIVLVSPPWSAYAIRARTHFVDAVKELTVRDACTVDDFFIVIDDDPVNKNPFWSWLGFPGNPRPPVDASIATGAGSVLWLCDGKIADYEFNASHIGVEGLVAKTLEVIRGERSTASETF